LIDIIGNSEQLGVGQVVGKGLAARCSPRRGTGLEYVSTTETTTEV
jgi:hypothetical protein